MNKGLILFFLILCASCFGQPLVCVTNGGVMSSLRVEGLTELVGDFLVICTGGTPTAGGAPIPATTIQLFLNTDITSRCVESNPSAGCIGQHSEALLILDEPNPGAQYACPTNSCTNLGTGTGAGGYGPGASGTTGNNKNVFQGVQISNNQIAFTGIPFDPPGHDPGAIRIIRITNVRANANFLGVAPGNNPPNLVNATIVSNAIPITSPTQSLGYVGFGKSSNVQGSAVLPQGVSQNPALATDPNSSGTSQFSLRFGELFSTAFNKRNIATSAADPTALSNQNDLTFGQFNTESGFYSSSLTLPANSAPVGLADSGARLMARFTNVPSGVSLFSRVSATVTGGGPGVVRMVNADVNGAGPYSPVAGNAFGIASIPVINGAATAVYEVVEADPNSFATVDVPIYVAYISNGPLNMPGAGTATVSLSYAPLSVVTSAAAGPVPRFADVSSASNAFTVQAPPCTTLGAASASFGASGGTGSTTVTAAPSCQWTASTIENWIGVSSDPHSGNGVLNFEVASSVMSTPRSGVITLSFGQSSIANQTFTINQAALVCGYTMSPTASATPAGGGPGWFALVRSSNLCAWNVVSNDAWITVTYSQPGDIYGLIGYSVAANTGPSRTGTLTVAGLTFTITQQGQNVPSPGSLNSVSGAGATHTFVFTFSDPDGWQDLGVVNVLINNFLDGRNACYLAYDRPNNVLYLVGDSGGGLTGIVLDGSGNVANSQCTVNGAGSSASGTGATLTLTLSLSFNQTAFAGEKVTYLAARDIAQNNSGWRTMGVWSVPRQAPVFPSIISVSPSEGAGNGQFFSVTYRDVSSSANLRTAQLLINSDLNGNLGCYIGYDHANNVLYLVNDNNSGLLLPGVVPNSGPAFVENSQCVIFGATKIETGTDLTLTINLAFRLNFIGPKVVYAGVQTISNANSDWHALGLWNVPYTP